MTISNKKLEEIRQREAIRVLLISADQLVREARAKLLDLYPTNQQVRKSIDDLLEANLDLRVFVVEDQSKDKK